MNPLLWRRGVREACLGVCFGMPWNMPGDPQAYAGQGMPKDIPRHAELKDTMVHRISGNRANQFILSYWWLLTYPVLLSTTFHFFPRPGSKIWVRARNWPPRMLQTENHRLIRRLQDPNPMEDVLDQDSAPPQTGELIQSVFCLPKHSWAYNMRET